MKMPDTKFDIGNEIYFMDFKQPQKGTIQGITSFVGRQDKFNGEVKVTEGGEPQITYHIKNSSLCIGEGVAFATKDELKDAVFDSL